MSAPGTTPESATPQTAAPLDPAAIRAIMAGILLAMFLSALEQTIVAPALPTMGRAFGDVENLSWVVTAYLLATVAAVPLFGKLADIHGRRRMMLIAIGVFVAGSVACALAPNIWTLIAARAVQGVGGGGILPLAHTVIGDMVSPRERPRYQAYTSAMFLIASISGPLLGGVLTDYVHWTMIFWINLPMGLIALWLTDRVLRKLPRNDRPHKLDFPGAALMVCAALALMLAMTWGGTRYGWGSWPILSLLAGSAALWLLFSLRVATAPEPFIPLAVLREPVVGLTAVAGFFGVGTIIGLSIVLPLYFELALGFTPSGSGSALIVFLAAATAGSFLAGRLMTRFVRFKFIPVGGLSVGIVALALLALRPTGLSFLEVSLLLALGGTGLGVMYPVTTVMVQNAVAPHQLGTATGSLNFARQLGGAMIVAAFATILLGGLDASGGGLTLEMLAHGGKRGAMTGAGAEALGATPGGADFALQFRLLFAAGVTFLAAGLIAVLATEDRPLRG
jgi:EmrB/QacA subfamily drug resistance transporter